MQSLERSIRVIVELSKRPEGIALGDLAEATDLHKSTLFRILKTLKEHHFARQDRETQIYFLGLGILELTFDYLTGLDIRQAALGHMRKLNNDTQETVNLGVLDGYNVVYIERVESRQMLRTTSPVGKRTPAFCTALGKAMLAFASEDAIQESLFKKPLQKLTPFTKTDPQEIIQELDGIRESFIAIDDRENQEQVRCIAAPIIDAKNQAVAAVSISAPASRINIEDSLNLQAQVFATAEAISRDFGGRFSESGLM
jgi:DNA-binding IclR family transcriptional regulator